MREITTYVAYDDTEFNNREECEAYEDKAFDLLEEIFNAYDFFKENGQEIFIFLNEVESGLKAFEWAWYNSVRIRVKHVLSNEAKDLIDYYFGCIQPPDEIGLYEYDWKNYEGWIKVSE